MNVFKGIVKYFYEHPRDFVILALLCIIGYLYLIGNSKDQDIKLLQMKAYKTTPQRIKVVTIVKNTVTIRTRLADGSTTAEDHYAPPEGGVTIKEESIPYDGYSSISPSGYDSLNAPDEPKKGDQPVGNGDMVPIVIEDGNTFDADKDRTIIIISSIVSNNRILVSEVIIKDKGWCLRPGFGAAVDNTGQLQGVIDLKYYFINRYSALVFITKDFAGLSASRHIDDLTSKFKLYNTEMFFL